MRVAVYFNNRDIRVETRPIPQIGAGELLVKTEACGLCGGEAMEWYLVPRAPKVLGHEPTGVVVRVGAGVTQFREGDPVFVHHHVACLECHFCRRGYYTLCDRFKRTNLDPGGFAEYFRVPAEIVQLDVHRLPDGLSFEVGTVIEPLACALKGINRAGIQPGDTVAIVGVGFMGMCYLQLARLQGAGRIVALDLNDWRLDKAQALGATHTLNPQTVEPLQAFRDLNQGLLADVVIVTAPSLKAWELGMALCEKGATLHGAAPMPPDAQWSAHLNKLYFSEITVNFSYSASHLDIREALDLLNTKRFNAQPLITHTFGLEQVGEAIQLLLRGGESLKILIKPSLS